MHLISSFCTAFLLANIVTTVTCRNVLTTEVFEVVVDHTMFNWTYEGIQNQFVYQPSLLGAPDLPAWIYYVYSEKHHMGYLYGVPPNVANKVPLEIIGLNRQTYETKNYRINITIIEKSNPAKYEIQLKIDNLNVEDMFDVERMERLKEVIKKYLWKNSEANLYMTYLASAIDLGARLPLDPTKGEGVVLRLGSNASFSEELAKLQEEVRPLLKMLPCPREFKRTTVERHFREAGFTLDWCSFRLLSAVQDPRTSEELAKLTEQKLVENRWNAISKKDIPQRSYVHEFLFTILVPMFVMTVLAILLSLVLCFHHEGISKRMENTSATEITQYATINRATYTLRSLSNQRDLTCLSPDAVNESRSHTNSPTSTITRGLHCRPSPPPYVKPKFSADF